MTTARHTWFMIGRQVRNLLREPIWVAITLVQPVIWLLLYGALFKSVTRIPGFDSNSYIQFLAPGVVIMNAFFGATWSGMAMIDDLDKKWVERFLATPASRLALVLSQVVRAGLTAIVQALVILVVGLALGVRVHGGALGWLVVLLAAALISTVFGGISQGIALLVRREATMIGVANFLGLPLMFLSSILISRDQMPDWMELLARFNPVNWATDAARYAIVSGDHWGAIGVDLLLLVGATAATSAFATWTFNAYQRSL
jgi:ABC-2 type transport system permease protein